jgi:hypothetical protein
LATIVLPKAGGATPRIWVGFKEIQDYTKKTMNIMLDA